MNAGDVRAFILLGSTITGIALFGTHLWLHRRMIWKYILNDDFWFEAQPVLLIWEYGPQ